MTPEPGHRTAYADLETTAQMYADCRQVDRNLQLRRVARAVVRPAPSLHFEDYPREVRKREIPVSEAAARLAAALHLHLD